MPNLATDLVRVTLNFTTDSLTWDREEAQMTFHLRYHQGTANVFNWDVEMEHLPHQLWDKLIGHWDAAFGGYMHTGAEMRSIRADHLSTLGKVLDRGIYDPGSAQFLGSGGNTMLPPEVAVAVSWWSYEPGHLTTHRGRKRGRYYLPYIAANMSTAYGRMDGTHLTALALGQQAWINDVQGMHTYEGADPDSDYWDWVTYSGIDATWHNADWVSVDDKFDSQRRREHQASATRVVETISHA